MAFSGTATRQPCNKTETRTRLTYDVFGNLQSTAGGGGRATPTSQHTNRLTVAGTRYQQDGSLIEADGRIYRYGAFGEVLCASSVFPDNPCVQDDGSTSPPSQQTSAVYIYDASDERIWEYDLAARSQWAIRDLGGQVLREYTTDNGVFTYEDTIRGLGRVLAAETTEGRRYLHTDHLGTVRQTTDREGNEVAYDVYYPYGREATTSDQDGLQWKFTGHERDFNHTGSAEDDLDYMHARYYSPGLGRFTTTDPINSGKPGFPQTWNKYTYATASPLTKVDPDGREPVSSTVVVVSATAAAAGAVAVWASSPNPVQPEMTNLEVVQEDLREGAEALIDLGRVAIDTLANIFASESEGSNPETVATPEEVDPTGGINAGDVRKLTDRRLKQLGVNAEEFKKGEVGDAAGSFDIGATGDGRLVLISKGGDIVDLEMSVDDLQED